MANELPRRADARRNRKKLLEAARTLIDVHGRDIALEEVARQAGVAIGTLYNHFPTRQALFQAVFADEAEALRQRAANWAEDPDPGEALFRWLRLQLEYGSRGRSLGAAVMNMRHEEGSAVQRTHVDMRAAGEVLLQRAQVTGQVRPDVDLTRILRLILGILLANEDAPDPEGTLPMLQIVIDGISAFPSKLSGACLAARNGAPAIAPLTARHAVGGDHPRSHSPACLGWDGGRSVAVSGAGSGLT